MCKTRQSALTFQFRLCREFSPIADEGADKETTEGESTRVSPPANTEDTKSNGPPKPESEIFIFTMKKNDSAILEANIMKTVRALMSDMKSQGKN